MKFLHTADIHIGKSRSLPDYLARQDTMMREIFSLAKSEKVDYVLIVGDVFDRKDVNAKEKDMFLRHISEADRDGIKSIIIDGNHDLINEGYTHLHFLHQLVRTGRLKNTTVVEIEPTHIKLSDTEHVIAIPAKYYKGEEVNAIVGFYLKRIHQYAEDKDIDKESLTIIAMVHETVKGSVNDVNFPFSKGAELDHSLPVTYWALGDIHKCQSIPGVPNAWYSGSPIQHDFGDADDKGVLIVDTFHPTKPKHIKLPGIKPLVTVTEAPKDGEDWPDGYIRFVGTAEAIADIDLPSSVVKTKPIIDEQEAITFLQKDDLLEGLPEYLASQGLSKEDQTLALAIADELRKSSGI